MDKEWLKKELQSLHTSGSLEAIFDTTISLLEARIKWLNKMKAPAKDIIRLAKTDMEAWRDELRVTEEDDV